MTRSKAKSTQLCQIAWIPMQSATDMVGMDTLSLSWMLRGCVQHTKARQIEGQCKESFQKGVVQLLMSRQQVLGHKALAKPNHELSCQLHALRTFSLCVSLDTISVPGGEQAASLLEFCEQAAIQLTEGLGRPEKCRISSSPLLARAYHWPIHYNGPLQSEPYVECIADMPWE